MAHIEATVRVRVPASGEPLFLRSAAERFLQNQLDRHQHAQRPTVGGVIL